jgi:hypothetical protein
MARPDQQPSAQSAALTRSSRPSSRRPKPCPRMHQVLYYRVVGDKLEFSPDADGYLTWLALGVSEAGLKVRTA